MARAKDSSQDVRYVPTVRGQLVAWLHEVSMAHKGTFVSEVAEEAIAYIEAHPDNA